MVVIQEKRSAAPRSKIARSPEPFDSRDSEVPDGRAGPISGAAIDTKLRT